ncbi:MarR family transcriptional regulator [Martelella mediterranea]|uniref:MarR family winged helix-turn-helix transcriptional regulator n=1 Tax=Martelella mediterranea TaxID=293089 RepID=UPI001E3C3892|nr:MarR family transcriptional regulator [Martelella mediterranea]MCD1636479.1 MarR family transcriptional regulator [Martelella mediterranea]
MSRTSPELQIAFVETLGVASRKMRTLYDARVSRLGLTFSRARVLTLLARHGSCSQSALACELELEKPTLVRTLDRMAELDLIERVADPNDRRVNLVQLRPHGEAMAGKLLAERAGFIGAFFTPEDDEALEEATGLLQAIIARIERLEREP